MSDYAVLAHQFDDLEQQHEADTLGMWLFLATEVLFFGGLFLGYTVYRHAYFEGFAAGSAHLDIVIGTTNTIVLLASSFTMAMSVHSASLGNRRLLLLFLLATILLGSVFLGLKGYEYWEKYDEHLIPGRGFQWHGDPRVASQAEMFVVFYFVMTGMHALHMIIGVSILLILTFLAYRGRFHKHHNRPIEIFGLYWHFVDIVWIFLFPLLYLVERHH